MTTYTKLRDGNWGLRGTGLAPGTAVEVTKRDGTVKTETVEAILWTGPDGTQLATIAAARRHGNGNWRRRQRECACEDACCRYHCRCDDTCACRGGNIYDCLG